jgi:ABC-type lipoprotein export system ATPase subunit
MEQGNPFVHTHLLTKTYQDGDRVCALENVTLNVNEGEILAVQGPSGSGKSTLLNLIGTLDQPTSGKIIIGGEDLANLSGDALADFRRGTIGFVFQLFNLVPTLNSLDNVMLPLLPYRRVLKFDLKERAKMLLAKMGLGDRLGHLPGQLSGGEQQRVAIARALINSPRLILADEPTGNLDTKIGQETVSLLRQLNQEQGITIAMVTHDATVASQADRIIHLKDGRLLEQSA